MLVTGGSTRRLSGRLEPFRADGRARVGRKPKRIAGPLRNVVQNDRGGQGLSAVEVWAGRGQAQAGRARAAAADQFQDCWTRFTTAAAPRELLLSTVVVVADPGSWTDRAETPAS